MNEAWRAGMQTYLESNIFDVSHDLGPGREEGDGAGGQVPYEKLLLVRAVHCGG
jgi:hypothetical protein